MRAVPSLRYKEYTPAYADLLDNPDGIRCAGSRGGFTWDGRANTLDEQPEFRLLSAFEMANGSAADVVAKLGPVHTRSWFGRPSATMFSSNPRRLQGASAALQAFHWRIPVFIPIAVKFDLYAGNKIGGALTPAEARGAGAVQQSEDRQIAPRVHYQGRDQRSVRRCSRIFLREDRRPRSAGISRQR